MASASTWPLSRQTALDLNGDVVPGARLYFFEAGTSTPLTVFSDPALTAALPAFPDAIETDANGRWPRIYLPYEDYRERITTPDGVLLSDDDGIANPAPPTTDTTVPISQRVQTGMLSLSFGPQDGYVRPNGLTIGNAISGATERANDDTKPLFIYLYENLVDAVAPVSGGRGANAETDYAAGKTITLPDYQGVALAGIIGMGGAASTLLDAVTFTVGSKTQPGSRAGAATHTLTAAQIPAHTHPTTVSLNDPGHQHSVPQGALNSSSTPGGSAACAVEAGVNTTGSQTGITVGVAVNNNTGGGNSHPNMQPTGLVYLLVKL